MTNISVQSARLGRAVGWSRPLLRWRYPVLVLVATGFSILHVRHTGGDWRYLVRGSELLLGQHRLPTLTKPGGLHLYANYPELQIGPLTFLVFLPFRVLGEVSRPAGVVVLTATGVLLVWFLERLAKRVHPPSIHTSELIELTTLVGGSAVVAAWYAVATKFMHLDDVLVLVLACLALAAIVRKDGSALGVLIGLAVAAKPTGLILLPLVLQLQRPLRWRAVSIAGLIAGSAWLPFVITDADTLTAFRPQLYTENDSVLHLIGVGDFPAWVRPAQLLLALAVGTFAVWRGRWGAVVLVALAARIVLDPGSYEYYLSSLLLASLAWDLLRSARPLPVWTMATFWLFIMLRVEWIPPAGRALIRLAVSVGVIASIVMPRRALYASRASP